MYSYCYLTESRNFIHHITFYCLPIKKNLFKCIFIDFTYYELTIIRIIPLCHTSQRTTMTFTPTHAYIHLPHKHILSYITRDTGANFHGLSFFHIRLTFKTAPYSLNFTVQFIRQEFVLFPFTKHYRKFNFTLKSIKSILEWCRY